jgi:hypothetical protein
MQGVQEEDNMVWGTLIEVAWLPVYFKFNSYIIKHQQQTKLQLCKDLVSLRRHKVEQEI